MKKIVILILILILVMQFTHYSTSNSNSIGSFDYNNIITNMTYPMNYTFEEIVHDFGKKLNILPFDFYKSDNVEDHTPYLFFWNSPFQYNDPKEFDNSIQFIYNFTDETVLTIFTNQSTSRILEIHYWCEHSPKVFGVDWNNAINKSIEFLEIIGYPIKGNEIIEIKYLERGNDLMVFVFASYKNLNIINSGVTFIYNKTTGELSSVEILPQYNITVEPYFSEEEIIEIAINYYYSIGFTSNETDDWKVEEVIVPGFSIIQNKLCYEVVIEWKSLDKYGYHRSITYVHIDVQNGKTIEKYKCYYHGSDNNIDNDNPSNLFFSSCLISIIIILVIIMMIYIWKKIKSNLKTKVNEKGIK